MLKRYLPEGVVEAALRDDTNVVIPYFRASPDRLYLREYATGRTVFHLAAMAAKANVLRELIATLISDKQPFSVNDVDLEGRHPVHVCAKLGHLEHLELFVRINTAPDGKSKFPFPLVDNCGLSVAASARVPVEWGTYGSVFAPLFTKPPPQLHPSQFGLDDIILVLTLKASFRATPLPWVSLPTGLPLVTDSPRTPATARTAPAASPPPPPAAAQVDLSAAIAGPPADPNPPLPTFSPLTALQSSAHVAPLSKSALSLTPATPTGLPSDLPTDAFGVLVPFKPPLLVAQMICLGGSIQLSAEMFFFDDSISGPMTYRGTALQVDYYRCTAEPDVVLASWRTVVNPDTALIVCKRTPPTSRKAGARVRRAVNALEASMELYSKTQTKMRPDFNSSAMRSPLTGASGEFGDSSVQSPANRGSDPQSAEDTHLAPRDTQEEEDLSVVEASNMILQVLRQCVWNKVRDAMAATVRNIIVVKRFLKRVLAMRNRCVNLFFTKFIATLDAVRKQLEQRRIPTSAVDSSSHLSINVPMRMLFTCCRKAIRRKDNRWHINIHEVIAKVTPLAVAQPDLQATLGRFIMDEWLVPTAERERMAALARQNEELQAASLPRGRLGSPRRGDVATTGTGQHPSHRRHQHQPAVLQCTARSPIPLVLGTTSELKALWTPKHPFQPK